MRLSKLYFFIVWISLVCSVSHAQASVIDCKSLENSALFAYFQKEFGPKFKCTLVQETNVDHKYLKLKSKSHLEIKVSDVITAKQRFSWMSINLPIKKPVKVDSVYTALMTHFRSMGLAVEWNKFYTFAEGDDRVLIYCDSLYQTGLLASARFRNNQLVNIQFGYLEKYVCPKSLESFNKLFVK